MDKEAGRLSEQKEMLLPCPFCGGNAENDDRWVYCVECGVGYAGETGVQQWNRRISDAKDRRIAELEGLLDRMDCSLCDTMVACHKHR